MKKIGLLSLLLLLALGGLGISYAGWSQNLTMNATMVTAATKAREQYIYGTTTDKTLTATWPSATTAGNLLVAIVSYGNTDAIITPPSGKGWTLAVSVANPGHVSTAIYYIENAASQNGPSTWTSDHKRDYALILIEYSGVALSSALDKTANAYDKSTTASTGTTLTTTQANELAIGAMVFKHDSGTFALLSGGFSKVGSEVDPGNNISVALEKFLSAAGTCGQTATIPGNYDWAGAVATFK